jgi:hypothetical protein
MKPSSTENQFATIAATFCLIGLALLLSVMIWHQQINQHPLFKKGVITSDTPELQVASMPAVAAPTVTTPTPAAASPVPESVIQEITTDPRNIASYTGPTEEMSPAIKFLYTLTSPNVFPTQR